jgi:hypothetical protein
VKVGDLVRIKARHKKDTLRPPWYGKTGIIVDHEPGPWVRPLTSPNWHVLVDGNIRKLGYLYLKVINESR